MLINCPSCGSENPAHRRYCRKCGHSVGTACPGCTFFNVEGDLFCGGCGAKLETAARRPVGVASSPLSDDMGLDDGDFRDLLPGGKDAPGEELPEERVSPSEIDDLFRSMDEIPPEGE
jgi:hypothetical protein